MVNYVSISFHSVKVTEMSAELSVTCWPQIHYWYLVCMTVCFRTVRHLVLQRLILATIVIIVISCQLVTSRNHL